MLAVKVEEGARRQAEEEAAAKERGQVRPKPTLELDGVRRPGHRGDDGGIVADVVKSGAFKDFMRTAAREIARGMFGTARRR